MGQDQDRLPASQSLWPFVVRQVWLSLRALTKVSALLPLLLLEPVVVRHRDYWAALVSFELLAAT